jgi:hypothetical protein
MSIFEHPWRSEKSPHGFRDAGKDFLGGLKGPTSSYLDGIFRVLRKRKSWLFVHARLPTCIRVAPPAQDKRFAASLQACQSI